MGVKGHRPIFGKALNLLQLIRREPTHTAIGVPNIVARPIGSGVPRRLSIDAMRYAFDERPFARISKDCLKEGGRFLPILSTRRSIPIAAFWLKKYFCGGVRVSMHGNNVDTAALLRDSEIFAVKHTPRHTIPEFVQRFEYDGEVSSSMAREKAEDVFKDNGSWHSLSNDSHKLMK